jgi:predicted O-methyltransferase YrrM
MNKYTALDDRLHAYLLAHQPPEHGQLQALRARTSVLPDARIQITPEQGHFLALLVRLVAARRVLEIGTFTGYSALAMALALQPGARLTTCDVNAEWTAVGREYWCQAGVADRINLRLAPAIDTLQSLEKEGGTSQFDMAFIDADKTSYDAYYEAALRLVRTGGLIVLDNTLRRGRLADPSERDADTLALRAINTKIAADERVDRVLLPIASGMTLARLR